ncbi:MAG TPA: hypothetical protein PK728_09795 [Bacillota bacterium]|nr:hypothetical protein [Bacillota bacterium]
MKQTIPIEHVKKGDIINGKKVVEVLHRTHANYVRLVLEGGWPIVHGSTGKKVEVERPAKIGPKNAAEMLVIDREAGMVRYSPEV